MDYTKLNPRHTTGSRVEELSQESSHFRLSIPSGEANRYRLAQLDDYAKTKRKQFPLRYPITLTLAARASNQSIPGTWGFGLWNDPFGLSLGFGGNPWRLPALPNAVWFFGASEESYLSFRAPEGTPPSGRCERNDEGNSTLAPCGLSRTSAGGSVDEALVTDADRASSTNGATYAPLSAQRDDYVANGFLAQTFRSPKFHPLLIAAGLALPFSRQKARQSLGKVIADDGVQLWSPTARRRVQELAPALHNVDVTQWHKYKLDWRESRVSFEVDEALVFESSVSPRPPLGLVIWIDNQFAAFTPEGQIGFGVLENPEPAWLEVKDIEVKQH